MAKLTIREDSNGEWMGEGCGFYHWKIDWFAEEEPGECAECGAQGLESGWVCLDGGELYCEDCVDAMSHK